MQLAPFSGDLASTYAQLVETGAEFVIVAVVLYAVGRLLVVPAIRWGLARSRIDKTLESALGSLSHLVVVVLAVVVAARVAGFQGALAGSTLVAAGVTIAVGLAAQDVLGNFVSGAFIVTDPDLNVGDTIEWAGKQGVIVDIDLRVTRVRTPDNEVVVVPNNDLATSAVTNRTATGPVGISYQFGVDYTTDLDEIEALIVSVARDVDHVAENPEPNVAVDELTDDAVVVTGRIWIPNNRRNRLPAVRSAFIRGVHEACRTAGIDLSTTTQHQIGGELAVRERDPGDERDGSAGP
ncbi:mechanosensitive ion channel family protein [Halomicroarcula limicola]|uniref:Mechanosensitive ion channel family protein n=1 Tax=Haloarcula limicola TaxID=1429915 RepID=A0A8J7YD05_9EURY|nr:mechanosensitive ion channel family protein [Halomicroarcula limicola]MBV0924981.1 mechanosensitive ion channel family protein [Halomicroarcula limicola]